MVQRKVAAEFARLTDMEDKEERLLARANASASALARAELRKEAAELHEDAVGKLETGEEERHGSMT